MENRHCVIASLGFVSSVLESKKESSLSPVELRWHDHMATKPIPENAQRMAQESSRQPSYAMKVVSNGDKQNYLLWIAAKHAALFEHIASYLMLRISDIHDIQLGIKVRSLLNTI